MLESRAAPSHASEQVWRGGCWRPTIHGRSLEIVEELFSRKSCFRKRWATRCSARRAPGRPAPKPKAPSDPMRELFLKLALNPKAPLPAVCGCASLPMIPASRPTH